MGEANFYYFTCLKPIKKEKPKKKPVKMAVSSYNSFILSITLTLIVFAGMQLYKVPLAATEWGTILGGFLGSQLFVFLLTAISNLEMTMFGRSFQAKIFPELVLALGLALFAAGMVHRVCVTVCLILSIVATYFINRLSLSKYAVPVVPAGAEAEGLKKKKKK